MVTKWLPYETHVRVWFNHLRGTVAGGFPRADERYCGHEHLAALCFPLELGPLDRVHEQICGRFEV